MSIGRQRATDYLLWSLALAWPLGVFAQTSIPQINILMVIALALAALVVPDALTDRKLRVPFEVWAPAGIIALLAVIGIWVNPAPRHRETIEAIVLFMLIVQAAPSHEAIRRYVFTGTISVAVVTLISLLTPWLGLLPTTFSLRSSAAFTFPYSLTEGVHVLLVGAVLDVYVASDRRFRPSQRAWATASLILITMSLVGQGVRWVLDTHALPLARYPTFHAEEWAIAVVALWLIARVLAKVEVQRRIAPDRLYRLCSIVAAFTVGIAALAPLQPRGYQGVLLGFACAAALPSRFSVRATRWPVVSSAVLAALVAMNLIVVFPANVNDPRQYDAAAQREAPLVFDRMDWVDRHAPNERRTYLWRARAALDAGLPSLASFAFERAALVPEGATVLAPPTEAERQQFLVEIRDAVANIPEDRAVCAYERVLIADGERDSALYSLRLLTSVPLMHAPSPDASIFTPVVGLILGDPAIAEDLRAWKPDEVLTLLSHWGTDAAFAANADEAPGGIFILAAQRTWRAFNLLVRVGERVTRFEEPLAPVTQRDILPLAQISAMVWAGPGASPTADVVRYTLKVVSAGEAKPAAYVDVRADGSAAFSWAANPPVIEFTPAVRVRLAK